MAPIFYVHTYRRYKAEDGTFKLNKTYEVLNASRCILPTEIFNCRSFVAYEKRRKFVTELWYNYTVAYTFRELKLG